MYSQQDSDWKFRAIGSINEDEYKQDTEWSIPEFWLEQ